MSNDPNVNRASIIGLVSRILGSAATLVSRGAPMPTLNTRRGWQSDRAFMPGALRLKGRQKWNRSTWKPHQNKRECVRRLVQLAKRQLADQHGFISEAARNRANDLRLRALGLHPPGGVR